MRWVCQDHGPAEGSTAGRAVSPNPLTLYRGLFVLFKGLGWLTEGSLLYWKAARGERQLGTDPRAEGCEICVSVTSEELVTAGETGRMR